MAESKLGKSGIKIVHIYAFKTREDQNQSCTYIIDVLNSTQKI